MRTPALRIFQSLKLLSHMSLGDCVAPGGSHFPSNQC